MFIIPYDVETDGREKKGKVAYVVLQSQVLAWSVWIQDRSHPDEDVEDAQVAVSAGVG